MKSPFHIISMLVVFVISTCTTPDQKVLKTEGYNLSSPDEKIVLPEALHEISGMTWINPSTFACIEDENGILYFYDFIKKAISRQVNFYGHGDYEGLAKVNDTIYVLRSDGFLFEIADYETKLPQVTLFPTGIPKSDNEGLCYETDTRRLLITCKEYIGKGSKTKNKRVIFGFDLKTKQLSGKPVYSFDLKDIREFAKKHNISLPSRPQKKGLPDEIVLRFNPSEIAIHPLNRKLYILSAADHMLLILNINGSIDNVMKLNPTLFNQAEGLFFLENGDMFISNEGGNGPPTLLRFNYRKK